ncbi:MAG: (Dimethylallyl)adenosine tRNA methylthiotransferase MiaB [Promethearchaeota archaeon]|nr:MAG: (Dimethylallyl)adenosine tRNA methylthiotransferase MiaB [Candidatus Lokiarchaeota archaeon]
MLEKNHFIKDWRNIEISIGLVYPNIYEIGMSSYSIRLLYYLFNQYENVACERFFLPKRIKYPASDDFQSQEELRSIENKRKPKDFDILGFSIQFENDFKNILWILEKAGIPFLSSERKRLTEEREIRFPLIIAGGSVVTSNPKPISKLFDLFVIGDLEPILEEFLQIFLQIKSQNLEYDQFYQRMRTVKGIYIPKINNDPRRSILENLNDSANPPIQLTQSGSKEEEIFENTFFIEINRGCPYKCKFCITSFHNYPSRFKSYETIRDEIMNGMKYSDFDSISLIGPCASAHPEFKEICEFIIENNKRLIIPSIRIDHLSRELIKVLGRGNIKTITMAPETGSEDLRFQIGKKFSNHKILEILQEIKDSKISNVKLYFLIGLPNETDTHIKEMIEMLKKVDKLGFQKNAIRISINPLIPKLNTPYEKKVEAYLKEAGNKISDKYNEIKQNITQLYSIKLKTKNIKKVMNNARLQALFSLGDETVNHLLIEYYKKGANFGALRRAQTNLNFSIHEYFEKIKECYSPWRLKE